MEKRDINDFVNPVYLTQEKANEIFKSVGEGLEDAQSIENDETRSLIIEEWMTVRYEVLILLGSHVPTLFQQAQTELEKIALVKAYYNISNQSFRDNSDYFDGDHSGAIAYDCLTADSEINNMIIEMKRK